jgi:uncharacterized damage-inducible protein DinB
MTPEQGKLLSKVFLDTITTECEITKKVIQAIPEDKKSYKPDPKAKSAHELAWHIATSEVWFLDLILKGQAEYGEPAPPPTINAILDWYQSNHRDRVQKVEALAADKLVASIQLMPGFEMPAVSFLNLMNLHSAHHRGQLSSYLRPMGSKVPSIYGGSADEPFQVSN